MRNTGTVKQNGQDKNFNGYGGIEDLEKYIVFEYGTGWELKKSKFIHGVPNFKQSSLGPDDNNCTLAAITRIMKYYSEQGLKKIPNDVSVIYGIVREIGVRHGYDPDKSGLLRDLFVYTPFEIKTMVRDAWNSFGYAKSRSQNVYLNKIKTIRDNIDDMNPVLLNIAGGDYKGHTVSVVGYRIFGSSREASSDKVFVMVIDGWSETKRFIDWGKFGNTLANVTKII